MARVSIQGLGKEHGATRVLDDISLEIADGELLVLVGPSGCGKSTLLRCIAGLDAPTRGRIEIDGVDVTRLEPRQRDLAMVFQSYALYPHLTVKENLAFGLKMHKTAKAEIETRVAEAAAMLGLQELLQRTPKQLSGGQRQRVAMGRAVVRRPRAFLFDEPLSNLDASLRGQMRVELMRLHRRLSATIIYVTHDQVEAMTLADRIAVLSGGVLQQVGSPDEVYRRPANLFVARFVGMPEMNLLPAAAARAARLAMDLPDGTAQVGLRAEDLRLDDVGSDGAAGVVEVVEHLGGEALLHLVLDAGPLVVRVDARAVPRLGERVRVHIEPGRLHLFDGHGRRLGDARMMALALQVVLWHAYRADEQRALEHCARIYNAAHADVVVVPVAIPFDAYAYKLEAAIPRGNGPDLFVGKHDDVGEWSEAGLIVPVDEPDPDVYLPGTLEPLRAHGHLYGLPLTFKSLALFYRRDKLPHPPATTDELVADARAHGLAYEAGSFFYHAPWLHGFGGQLLDGHGRPALDSEAAVASLAFVRRLADEQLLPDESSSAVATQLFNDGRAALTINGPWFVGEIAPGVPFGVAPLPTVSATGRPAAPLVDMEAAMLPARAHQPAAAMAFARWLSGPEAALIRAREGRQPVAARAAWDDPAVAGDPVLAAFRAQSDATVPMSNAPAMRAVWEPAQRALRRVLRGAAEPRAALVEAERQINEALRPAPPPSAPLPYAVALGLATLALAAWAWRRLRAIATIDAGAWAYLLPAALAMALLVFVPFSVGAAMSLFHYDPAGPQRWIFVGARNFVDLLASREQPLLSPLSFYFTLAVTVLWTVANVALHVAIGVTLALLLRDPLLRFRSIYRVLLIVPWAVPNYITALIWKGMFHRQFGAINGLLAALGLQPISWFSRFWTAFCANLATNVWLGFPFMMVVTLGALSRIPKELEEAAALDGATRWQRLTQIVLPLLRPALLPSVLLGAVWTFNMFNIVFLVSGGEPDGATEILVSQAYRWAFTRGHRYGYAAAYAVLIFGVLALQSSLSRRATELDA